MRKVKWRARRRARSAKGSTEVESGEKNKMESETESETESGIKDKTRESELREKKVSLEYSARDMNCSDNYFSSGRDEKEKKGLILSGLLESWRLTMERT